MKNGPITPDNDKVSFTLTPEQYEKFQTAIKVGIYKELHRKALLTDEQLNYLITKRDD